MVKSPLNEALGQKLKAERKHIRNEGRLRFFVATILTVLACIAILYLV